MRNVFKVDNSIKWLPLVFWIFFTELTGFLSGFISMTDRTFYSNLQTPSYAPPGWIFPIVWTLLYFLMGTAAYRISLQNKETSNTGKSLTYYLIQLTFNFVWSIIFFRFQLFGLAFFELLILLVFIIITTIYFFKSDKLAGLLMLPYAIWVSFAGILNFAIWILNEA